MLNSPGTHKNLNMYALLSRVLKHTVKNIELEGKIEKNPKRENKDVEEPNYPITSSSI